MQGNAGVQGQGKEETSVFQEGRQVTNKLMTVAEVAELMQVSAKWVYDHAADETGHSKVAPALPTVRMGGTIRFDPEDLANFIKRKKRAA